jgi:hypothetical protein
MGLFGGKKKGKEKESGIPEVSDFPLKAYVYRLLPEKVGKIQLAGRIPGDFDDFTTQQDLEDMVARVCGGGTYRCKCVKKGETKTHVGYHTFTIPGAPLFDGQPIDGEPRSSKKEEPDRVNKIESEIEIEEAQARLDETRARRAAKRKQMGLDGDDDDDDTPTMPHFGMPGVETPEIAQLKANMKMLEKRLEDKDREMERERHRADMEKIKSENTAAIDALKAEVRNSNKGQGSDGVTAIVQAQASSVNAMLQASQQQTQAILTANSELIKAIMGRDPASGINERVDKLVDKLFDLKGNTSQEHLEIMKESFQTGIMMAKGGESAPTTRVDVARDFSGKVLDTVQEYMRQKGAMSKETLAQEIQKAAAGVVNQVKRSLPLANLTGRPALPPGGQPAMRREAPAPAMAASSTLSTEEIRQRVDKVMLAALYDIENETETWEEIARREIPPEDQARLGDFSFETVALYALRHGSPEIVQKVLAKLQEIGALTAEQATALQYTAGVTPPPVAPAAPPQAPPQQPPADTPESPADLAASAPSVSDGEVTADDNDAEALMGDEDGPLVAQGEAH